MSEENGPSARMEELRAQLDALGVKYHHKHGEAALEQMLAEAESAEGQTSEQIVEAAEEAARDFGETPVEPEYKEGMVRVRVTKWGAGKISTGDSSKPQYLAGDIFFATPEQGASYETKYQAEILDDEA
ncbi:MAG: hypothetical protein AAF709_11340 [Pseudomonadota bacterium]